MALEKAVEQKEGVAGFGGHARDAGNVDVGAFGPVEEVQVEVGGLTIGQQSGHQTAWHFIEAQSHFLDAGVGPINRAPGQGWNVEFRLDPKHTHTREVVDGAGHLQVVDHAVMVDFAPVEHFSTGIDNFIQGQFVGQLNAGRKLKGSAADNFGAGFLAHEPGPSGEQDAFLV